MPFPRYGAAVNATASKEGEIYMMGGLINGSTVKGDLWMVESGGNNLACYPVSTTFEGPGPRVGHASLLVGNAFIVFGGDTKMDEHDQLDDTLYLLNTCRYGHTLNILGSKIYVFGGQVEGFFFNDLIAFDLNALQNSSSKWEMMIPSSAEGGPPEGVVPPARTNHTIVTWNDRMYLFGGTNGTQWFSDVWSYDPKTISWTQLDCIGYIPAAREGHSAALVGDVMYIFGGRTEDGIDLGDLSAFRLTSRRWYTFQNMGPSPSPRSGHSMTAYGKQIVVLAGEPSSAPREPAELSLMYVLDTSKIRYPNDQPAPDRIPGARRPSQDRAGPTAVATNRTPLEPNRKFSRESMLGNVNQLRALPPPAGRGRPPQAPSGPPPQQQAPPPRANGTIMTGPGPRARTPTKDPRMQGDHLREESVEDPPGSRSMSPVVNGRRTPQRYQVEDDDSPARPRQGGVSEPTPVQSRPHDEELEALRERYTTILGQHEAMQQELGSVKSRTAWYASELALAKQAGYRTPDDLPNINDKPMVEALVAMRSRLHDIQTSVVDRESRVAQHLAEIEHQRDNALQEAALSKAKLAGHGVEDRSGSKLAAALQAQEELQSRLSMLRRELEQEQRQRGMAVEAAVAAEKRAESKGSSDADSLRAELHQIQNEARELAAVHAEGQSQLQLLQVERDELAEAGEYSKQQDASMLALKEALTASQDRASLLETKLDEERQRREAVDRRLLQLRSEHEERTAELDDTTRKLRDAEDMAGQHAAEAKTHRHALLDGLNKLQARSGQDSRTVDRHIPAFKQQLEQAHALMRKHQASADQAAERLRGAEERISGLESFQEQSSRENMGLRKQLQESLQETRTLQGREGEIQERMARQAREMQATTIRHDTLRNLLQSEGGGEGQEVWESRIKELEEQLDASFRAHQDTKKGMETREAETERTYREKLELLETDYKSAVHYVKGTEKMLKRMKDELSKYKKQNERLRSDLDEAQPANGEDLRRELDKLQQTTEQMRSELSERERESQQQRQEQERTQAEVEQLKQENNMLESRAHDAEQKVTLLLDQVSTSVGNYRRQSQPGHARNLSAMSAMSGVSSVANPAPLHLRGHAHQESSDAASESTAGPDLSEGMNRNSQALDSLASELEALRAQWADTHRNYRHSNQYDFDRSAPTSASGPGQMSDVLASWRKRLDEEEARPEAEGST